jgi:hypothetical protein
VVERSPLAGRVRSRSEGCANASRTAGPANHPRSFIRSLALAVAVAAVAVGCSDRGPVDPVGVHDLGGAQFALAGGCYNLPFADCYHAGGVSLEWTDELGYSVPDTAPLVCHEAVSKLDAMANLDRFLMTYDFTEGYGASPEGGHLWLEENQWIALNLNFFDEFSPTFANFITLMHEAFHLIGQSYSTYGGSQQMDQWIEDNCLPNGIGV